MYILQRVLRVNIDGTGFNQEQEHGYSVVRYIPLVRPVLVSPSAFTLPLSLPHHSHCPCLSLNIHFAPISPQSHIVPVSPSPFTLPLSLLNIHIDPVYPSKFHIAPVSPSTFILPPVSPSTFTLPLSLPQHSFCPCLSLNIRIAPVSPSTFALPLSLPQHSHCPCPHRTPLLVCLRHQSNVHTH